MTLSADNLRSARATLAEALLHSGLRPTEKALYWLLGMVASESRFGTSPDWNAPDPAGLNTPETNPFTGPSHNWGAVRFWQSGNAPFIWHHDKDASGQLYKGPGPKGSYKFQAYTSAVEGAHGFLRTILLDKRGKPHVVAALTTDEGTPELFAQGLYENGYYTGEHPGEHEKNIRAYAAMVRAAADRIRQALGATPGTPTPQIPTASKQSGIGTFFALALGLGGGYAIYRMAQKAPSRARLFA